MEPTIHLSVQRCLLTNSKQVLTFSAFNLHFKITIPQQTKFDLKTNTKWKIQIQSTKQLAIHQVKTLEQNFFYLPDLHLRLQWYGLQQIYTAEEELDRSDQS